MKAQTECTFHPRRILGRTGFKASLLGIGDLADRGVPFDECVATAKRAISAGLNVIDSAPSYENGYSEEIVGAAVRDVRDRMFVITKIDHPNEPVLQQVEGSLKRMKLQYTDCFLFHGCSKKRLWRQIASPGGGMEQLEECIRQGKTRFKGISSHDPDVLIDAVNSGLCDIVMFAAGPDSHLRYITEVLPLARSKNVGTICIKAFGAGKLLCDTEGYGRPLGKRPRGKISSGGSDTGPGSVLPHMNVEECVHYMLTSDPDVALLGMSFPNEQDAAFSAALSFKPLSAAQMETIRSKARIAKRGKGKSWWNP